MVENADPTVLSVFVRDRASPVRTDGGSNSGGLGARDSSTSPALVCPREGLEEGVGDRARIPALLQDRGALQRGGVGGQPGSPMTSARSHLVVACRAAGISPPIDSVYPILRRRGSACTGRHRSPTWPVRQVRRAPDTTRDHPPRVRTRRGRTAMGAPSGGGVRIRGRRRRAATNRRVRRPASHRARAHHSRALRGNYRIGHTAASVPRQRTTPPSQPWHRLHPRIIHHPRTDNRR